MFHLLQILCLHGYRQNGTVFKDKTGSLRKLLKKHAELIYITAPHLIPVNSSQEMSTESTPAEQRGWYFSTEEKTFNSHDVTDFSRGIDDSLEVIASAFRELGPFDGILGFSQGAALATFLCQLLQKGGNSADDCCDFCHYFHPLSLILVPIELKYSFEFVILVSGFPSKLSPHSHYYESVNQIKSLHVIGETDRIVEKGNPHNSYLNGDTPPEICLLAEMSEELIPHFQFPEILFHPGGHYVPATSKEKAGYTNFLEKFQVK